MYSYDRGLIYDVYRLLALRHWMLGVDVVFAEDDP
jgi:hypothetical protein